jgi:predicted CXXCH cytochrome family protein
MKRTLMICMGIAALVVFSAPAFAAVSGVCSECHTMHNSQGGTAMATGGPHPTLLMNDCLGCHTTTGTDPLDAGYPYVSGSSFSDDKCLAGGFFPGTMGTGDNDDDHHGIGNTNAPAGYDSGEYAAYSGTSSGLACAGANGCHGVSTTENDMDSIAGGHHNPTAYRILYDASDAAVTGDGSTDYEEGIIDGTQTTVTYGTTVNLYNAGGTGVTINALCAKCHGNFHKTSAEGAGETTNADGAWIRHPTENSIPTDWDIYSATIDADDAKHNPVGYEAETVSNANKRVMCISCHRAHGTANDDLLRWAYSTQDAGSGLEYGCLGCHNKQR